jgi:hypothetical protein
MFKEVCRYIDRVRAFSSPWLTQFLRAARCRTVALPSCCFLAPKAKVLLSLAPTFDQSAYTLVSWHSSDYRVDPADYAGLHGDRWLRAARKDESAALAPISCGHGQLVNCCLEMLQHYCWLQDVHSS